LFVKAGDDYVRVSTNVPKPDGSGRAIGTVLDPTGKAIAAIRQGQAFYGEVPILGTPYITGYEPIKDGSGNVTGIYYVGYKKSASAQADPKVAKAMKLLKAKTAKLGAPKIEGKDAVEGKDVPALYFGTTKMNNNFTVVDEVVAKAGGTATLFVKAGDDYVRVSTNVPKPDGSGRAIGTVLDPTGKAIAAIRQGQAFYGEVPILGTPYITGYEPIKDGSGNVTGIYYVGYKKSATISKRGFRKRTHWETSALALREPGLAALLDELVRLKVLLIAGNTEAARSLSRLPPVSSQAIVSSRCSWVRARMA
jgi:Cache 3/Cache 2 fusion domain